MTLLNSLAAVGTSLSNYFTNVESLATLSVDLDIACRFFISFSKREQHLWCKSVALSLSHCDFLLKTALKLTGYNALAQLQGKNHFLDNVSLIY